MGLARFDPRNRLIAWNRDFGDCATLSGRKPQIGEELQRVVAALQPPADAPGPATRWQRRLDRLAAARPLRRPMILPVAGGRWKAVHLAANAAGGLDLSLRDITRRVQRASRHARLQRDRRKEELARARLLAAMIHEMRTPLTGIIGMADLLREREDQLDRQKALTTILGAGNALLRIVNDLLDMSRAGARELPLEDAPFDLPALLEEVAHLMSPTLRDRPLALKVAPDPDLPRMLRGDAGRIRQILMNLLGNAVKFTPEGRILLRARGRVRDGRCRLRLVVEDSGIGIPPDQLEHVFEPFAQTDQGRSAGGAGLGLSISRRLAEAMGGSLHASSPLHDGRGTRMVLDLDLPVVAEGNAASARTIAAEGSESAPRDGASAPADEAAILVVEDNPTNRLVIEKMLDGLPARAVFAATGEAAQALFRADPFQLVLMDMSLPGMNGLETARALRRIAAEAGRSDPVIMALSARPPEDFERTDPAMDGWLLKPLRRARLEELIASLPPQARAAD